MHVCRCLPPSLGRDRKRKGQERLADDTGWCLPQTENKRVEQTQLPPSSSSCRSAVPSGSEVTGERRSGRRGGGGKSGEGEREREGPFFPFSLSPTFVKRPPSDGEMRTLSPSYSLPLPFRGRRAILTGKKFLLPLFE